MNSCEMWDGITDRVEALRNFGASRAVALELANRQFLALPRWVKVRLKHAARHTRGS